MAKTKCGRVKGTGKDINFLKEKENYNILK